MIITDKEVMAAIGIENSSHIHWQAHGISIDTRTIQPGNLFVAIKGENFDGHDFLQNAKEKGAIAALIEKEIDIDLPTLIVGDTLSVLQNLAKYKRQSSHTKMIAITGSVGKTTTKEMIYHALSCHGKTYRNVGNLNNHIGLPLSLLNAPDDAEYIILEMGMNHAGEIKELTNIMQPDVAIITNIGPVHIEFFTSIQEIAQAKAEIFVNTKGKVILNQGSEYYNYLYDDAKRYAQIQEIITVGKNDTADIKLISSESSYIQVSTKQNGHVEYYLTVGYQHIIENSLLALAVVQALELDIKISADNLKKFNLEKGRGYLHHKNGITIIDDSYNASPPSVKAALQTLATFQGRKIAILGDMLELGKNSKILHEGLAREVNHYKIDVVFTVDKYMKYLSDVLSLKIRGQHFDNADEVDLTAYLRKGDVILIKGSRAVKMEKIIQKLLLNV